MTPTFLGIVVIMCAFLLGAWRSKWRPYLEAWMFLWGAAVGFGGLGITLWKHATESERSWGWGALFSHWPSHETFESAGWHAWPAIIALVVAGHWWLHARGHHSSKYGGKKS